MAFDFRNLDDRTRDLMLEEIERDVAEGTLYLSDRLSPQGQRRYPDLLRHAARQGTELTLADGIRPLLNEFDKPRKLKGGGFSKPPLMRSDAHTLLADGEFNRFYIRALCLRAIADEIPLEVYRAKHVTNARSESQRKIGARVDPSELLTDLRTNQGLDTALGLPPGPGSGLSVMLA